MNGCVKYNFIVVCVLFGPNSRKILFHNRPTAKFSQEDTSFIGKMKKAVSNIWLVFHLNMKCCSITGVTTELAASI